MTTVVKAESLTKRFGELDEPANGLDPEGVHWLRDFMRSLASEGRTVLISSHVLAEVAQTVDQPLAVHR